MLLSKLLSRTTFDSYADFKKNYELRVPARFNFARDVVDAWAEADPRKRALVWLNDRGERREFTFAEISELSKKAANYLSSLGLKKGDRVLTLLKRNWQYWVTAVACHRMGVVIIPASVQLATKDIVYRVNFAGIRAIIATDDEWSQGQVEEAAKQCTGLDYLLLARGGKEGWLDYDRGIAEAPAEFNMPEIYNTDILLSYFTSGTTGMPKLVVHDQTYPLGHIVTAKFWQRVEDGGLHLTVSDSGWAKFGWGCIYGQWISGSAVLGYDFDKFNARNLINTIRTERPTTFCVPPTMYRFMMKEGVTREDFLSVRSCGTAGETVFGGASRILGPRGELLAAAGVGEEIVTAALDFSVLAEVRNSTKASVRARAACSSATFRGSIPAPAAWASPLPFTTSPSSIRTATNAPSARRARSSSAIWTRVCLRDCCAATGPRAACTAATATFTTQTTWPGRTKTASTGMWAATTTSSSAPATASGRSRSRACC